jgi:hypothetical protein
MCQRKVGFRFCIENRARTADAKVPTGGPFEPGIGAQALLGAKQSLLGCSCSARQGGV